MAENTEPAETPEAEVDTRTVVEKMHDLLSRDVADLAKIAGMTYPGAPDTEIIMLRVAVNTEVLLHYILTVLTEMRDDARELLT